MGIKRAVDLVMECFSGEPVKKSASNTYSIPLAELILFDYKCSELSHYHLKKLQLAILLSLNRSVSACIGVILFEIRLFLVHHFSVSGGRARHV